MDIDLFGEVPRKKFSVVRNTRPANAEEKARLSLELGNYLKRIPMIAKAGSVQEVRRWKLAVDECAKVAGKIRASVTELQIARDRMRAFFGENE